MAFSARFASRLIRRINSIVDRPADPAALTGRHSNRRNFRPDLVPDEPSNPAVEPVLGRPAPRPAELEGQAAIDQILAEQRSRMRGAQRNTGSGR